MANGYTTLLIKSKTRDKLKLLCSIKGKSYDKLINEKFAEEFAELQDRLGEKANHIFEIRD